jgi:hypothetical protein
MAKYHDKLLRLIAIDEAFKSYTRPLSKKKLLQICEDVVSQQLSDSTIEKDLEYMRHAFDAPIVFCRVFRGYYYSDNDYDFLLIFCKPMAEKLSKIRQDDQRI